MTIRLRPSSLTIERALLGFLRQGAQHGYAIHQQLSEPAGLGAVWRIKQGKLYALLAKLEDAGYVAATTVPQENKPPRKLFSLTERGKNAFLSWLQTPVTHGRSLRLEFLVKLYFARREGDVTAASLLAAQHALCREWLSNEQAIVDEEAECGREYSQLVHRFRLGQIEAMLSWLDHCADA